jgi:hypothetical protein
MCLGRLDGRIYAKEWVFGILKLLWSSPVAQGNGFLIFRGKTLALPKLSYWNTETHTSDYTSTARFWQIFYGNSNLGKEQWLNKPFGDGGSNWSGVVRGVCRIGLNLFCIGLFRPSVLCNAFLERHSGFDQWWRVYSFVIELGESIYL